jgi:hypothetical protein
MPKKISTKKESIHKDLKGFNIKINSFGEIESNFSIQALNEFLDEQLGKERRRLKDKDDDKKK